MKKLFFSIAILFIVYFSIQWLFVFFSTGHEVNYEIRNDGQVFKINELFKARQEKDLDNYYLKVNIKDVVFTYQVFENFDKNSQIIKDIKYHIEDNLICILPIFKNNEILFDVTCYDGQTFIPYHNISNSSESLKIFVYNLSRYDYVEKNWANNKKILKKEGSLIIYDNLATDHYIGISNYKGVSLINNTQTLKQTSVFSQDVYQQLISGFVNNYYVVADYTSINSFNEFEVVNIKTGAIAKISTRQPISYNSYILGVVENSLYLYDRENLVEYEINVKKQEVSIVGEKNKTIKYYFNGNWTFLPIADFNDSMMFDFDYKGSYHNKEYIRIVKIGDESGYYYLFKKVDNLYEVYRIDIQTYGSLTYLFTTTNYKKVLFLNDYIYYLQDNTLKYYNNKKGNRDVLDNSEFEFNKTIKFSIYEEK